MYKRKKNYHQTLQQAASVSWDMEHNVFLTYTRHRRGSVWWYMAREPCHESSSIWEYWNAESPQLYSYGV